MAVTHRVGLPIVLCILVLLALDSAAIGGARWVMAAGGSGVKQKECVEEGTVLIPGIGRYELGSHEKPSVHGLDHSGPAAANGQYIPGADDTFVPNPGLEVPNPAHGAVP